MAIKNINGILQQVSNKGFGAGGQSYQGALAHRACMVKALGMGEGY